MMFYNRSEQQPNEQAGDLSSVSPTYETNNPSTDSVVYSGLQRRENDYEDAAWRCYVNFRELNIENIVYYRSDDNSIAHKYDVTYYEDVIIRPIAKFSELTHRPIMDSVDSVCNLSTSVQKIKQHMKTFC